MKRFVSIATVSLLALPALVPAAAAEQPACDKRDNILQHLGQKYSEAPVAMGRTVGDASCKAPPASTT